MRDIYIDAGGRPVKQEVYRVAARYGLTVTIVANSQVQTPQDDSIRLVFVAGQFDSADDWIVEHVTENDIVGWGTLLTNRNNSACLSLMPFHSSPEAPGSGLQHSPL